MGLFGLFEGRKPRKPSKSAQEKLDELAIDERRQRLEDRKLSTQIVVEAVQTGRLDMLPAAAVLRPGAAKRLPPPAAPQSTTDRVTELLLERALEPEEDKLDRQLLTAAKRKQLERILRDDEDDDAPPEKPSLIRELLPLGLLLVAANNPQLAQAAGPALQKLMGGGSAEGDQPADATTPQVQVVTVQPVAPQLAPPTPAAPDAASPEAPPGVTPTAVLFRLQNTQPAVFAAWLMQQPGNEQLLELLDQDDEEIAARLQQYAAMPDLMLQGWGPVIRWLLANQEHAWQVAAAIRSEAATAAAGI